jgi:hypothetical protein
LHSVSRLIHFILPLLILLYGVTIFPNTALGRPRSDEEKGERRGEREGASREQEKDVDKETELTVVPLVGGDTDVGLGGGYLGSFARLKPNYDPYVYRIESTGYVTFRSGENGVELPYADAYLLLELPHVIREQLKVQLRVSYTKESALNYFGLGNASRIPEGFALKDRVFKHERVHPTFRASAEYWLTDQLSLKWGLAYTHNRLKVEGNSILVRDLHSEDRRVRELLGDTAPHGVVEFSYGVLFDTRDVEVSSRRGQYHSIRLDYAPGGTAGVPYRWARVNAAVRFYVPLTRRMTFAARALGDWLLGDPPFYELPRYDATSAIGGVNGVRGIPAQRYYGKIKVISNLELRTELFDFHFWKKTNTFGVTAFVDSGRVWTDLHSHPELDGTGLGIKYGLGGGVRLQAGKSFVLRLDAAWSEDARPLAGYLSAGQLF